MRAGPLSWLQAPRLSAGHIRTFLLPAFAVQRTLGEDIRQMRQVNLKMNRYRAPCGEKAAEAVVI